MYREKDALRLINGFAVSFVLHVFILSFSALTFWNQAGNSRYQGRTALHEPLTVRLIAQESSSITTPILAQEADKHSSFLVKQKADKTSSVDSTNSMKSQVSIYHTTQELTRVPEMLVQPPEAIETSPDMFGEVVFRLSIDRFGKVKLLQRLKSTLPREIEGKLALQLYRAEYRPGEMSGIAVDSEMIIDLKLDSAGWRTDKLPVLRQDNLVDPAKTH
jgi:hypothetical protein